MSTLAELSIFPLDKGISVSTYVAKMLKIIQNSGLEYELGPMGTCIEGEWEEIMENGKFEDEIIKICPKVKKGKIKPKLQKHIYDFSYEYANDSGNVPSC